MRVDESRRTKHKGRQSVRMDERMRTDKNIRMDERMRTDKNIRTDESMRADKS